MTRHPTPLTAKILVFVDLPEGALDDAGKGILSEASRLGKDLDCAWSAACFAGAPDNVLKELSPYGTEKLTLLDGPDGFIDSLEAQAKTIAGFAVQNEIGIVLLPHNDLGGSLAPLIAAELNAALFTEAIAYSVKDETLHLTHKVLGAQVAETKIWNGSCPLVLTIHPQIMSAVVLPSIKPGTLRFDRWQAAAPITFGPTKIVERIPPDPQTVDVSEAEVIVSAGLGCNEKAFAQIEELTRLLNASLGVTRPVYDLGFAGFERMVGQTGKTVAPRFYLALGISGSMHHVGGIKDSKRIVAINIDPKAPIIPNSDEAFVADLREVMPLLVERIKSATGGAA
jgi:electron transfer flavoprotein alpha subunit